MRQENVNDQVLLVTRAFHIASQRHVDQRRKGEKAEPYVNHLAEVAELVAEATGGRDANLIAAAALHDAIEDTGMTHAELVGIFGTDVADLVREVSDDKGLPKAERKRLQIANAPHTSRRAKVLKLADKTSNVRALVNSPPIDWPLERRQQYLVWACAVVAGLRGANAWLEGKFDEAAARLERSLKPPAPSQQRRRIASNPASEALAKTLEYTAQNAEDEEDKAQLLAAADISRDQSLH